MPRPNGKRSQHQKDLLDESIGAHEHYLRSFAFQWPVYQSAQDTYPATLEVEKYKG